MLEVVVRDEPERSERRKAAACGARMISPKAIDFLQKETKKTKGMMHPLFEKADKLSREVIAYFVVFVTFCRFWRIG